MAENNESTNSFNDGDILGSLYTDVYSIRQDTSSIRSNTEILKSIDESIESILKNSTKWSQSNARDELHDRKFSQDRRDKEDTDRKNRDKKKRNSSKLDFDKMEKDFMKGLSDQMLSSIGASNIKKSLESTLNDFAKELGVEFDDLSSFMGKQLGMMIQDTNLGKSITEQINSMLNAGLAGLGDSFTRGVNNYYNKRWNSRDSYSNWRRQQQDVTEEEFYRYKSAVGYQNAQREQAGQLTIDVSKLTKEDFYIDKFLSERNKAQREQSTLGKLVNKFFYNREIDEEVEPPEPESHQPDTETSRDRRQTQEEKKFDMSQIFEDKLNYLYTINEYTADISKTVREIALASVGSEARGTITKDGSLLESKISSFTEQILSPGIASEAATTGEKSSLLPAVVENLNLPQLSSGVQMFTETLGGGSSFAQAALQGLGTAGLQGAAAMLAISAASWLLDKAVERFKACFEPLQESFKQLKETISKVNKRFFESEKAKLDEREKRIQADVEELVKKPFEIMNEAAEEWYSTWNSNLQTVSATQGYTKADFYNLMSSYAERIRDEGLSSVVSATDMTSNLTKVLEAGLSGEVAEEFAYLATVLGEAIPTQDFFSYADTYASWAYTLIQSGYSQAEAIAAANEQLLEFADSTLYASRQLSGGFSTGLSNASDVYDSVVKIAQTAKIQDTSELSAALTAISSVAGAIDKDFASSLVNTIVEAATGGNSESLVALRSLAGTGASNTAFLNALVANPQKVLSTLFSNLSSMQNMSGSNYMEVAESLSNVFGISLDTFARLDFSSLVDSLSTTSTNLSSLESNLKLLSEGETTTTAEQLKMQQINEMILNEGLSYVIDNEFAQLVQQHMWDQELAEQMQETTYAVELEGSALEFLEGIKETVTNIINFLNPFSWLNKVANLVITSQESSALKADIAQVLEAGKVGSGNAAALHDLLTYDVDKLISVPDTLVTMMGGTSLFGALENTRAVLDSFYGGSNFLGGGISLTQKTLTSLASSLSSAIAANSTSTATSQYNWATVGKTISNAILATPVSSSAFVPTTTSLSTSIEDAASEATTSTQSTVTNRSRANMQSFLDTIESYVEDNKTYDEWAATASNYGISDLSAALEDFDMTEAQLQSKFQEYQASKAAEFEYNHTIMEEDYWTRAESFMEEYFPEFAQNLYDRLDVQIDLLTNIDATLTSFFTSWTNDWLIEGWTNKWLDENWGNNWIKTEWEKNWLSSSTGSWGNGWLNNRWDKLFYKNWVDYFVTHETYTSDTGNAATSSDVQKVINSEKSESGDAILELAKALTSNVKNLKDPQVQTNTLLAQILVVVEAIMQAENTSGSASLSTTLSALAAGLTTST